MFRTEEFVFRERIDKKEHFPGYNTLKNNIAMDVV